MRKDPSNPRDFPRFRKNPLHVCPLHQTEMAASQEVVPPFLSISLQPKGKRDTRTIYRCTVNGCPRVEHGDVTVYKGVDMNSEGWMKYI